MKRDLNADLRICEAATAGPWIAEKTGAMDVVSEVTGRVVLFAVGDDMTYLDMAEEDERFVIEARTGWPHAINRAMAAEERAREFEEEVERLRKMYET
jgi:hypothetical protein